MNLRDRYMLEEEREDDARMRQGEPHTWSALRTHPMGTGAHFWAAHICRGT